MRTYIINIILFFMGMSSCAHTHNDIDSIALRQWQAGKIVTAEAVEAYGGVEKCFRAEPVPDGVWARMQGKTYKENPYIGRADLRHIRALHWDYDQKIHIGEMVCNAQIADCVVRILRQLYDARYPIQRMLLPDVYDADDETQMRDNNTSCFCYRVVSGSTTLSKHARGLAIDINTLYNPYYKDRKDGTFTFSLPLLPNTVTVPRIFLIKLTVMTCVTGCLRKPDLSGAATGLHVRISNILNINIYFISLHSERR